MEYFERLQEGWARFNGIPLVRSHSEQVIEVHFQSARNQKKQEPCTLTRQEHWEQSYEASPYLRTLPDDEVLSHGARVFHALAPYFLKGGPRLSPQELEPLMVAWSDFLQESSHRGLDLRNFQANAQQGIISCYLR
jgi:hypothetical protein